MHEMTSLSSALTNLPSHLMAFIDRDVERPELARRLRTPQCRLLTVTGPGGIGKTRLALAAAGAVVEHFVDGVYFVNLQPAEAAASIPTAIAAALKLTLRDSRPALVQVGEHLATKEMLLLLDNFEHLMAGGVDILLDILAAAPRVKLLVTSREVLNLREEWIYHLYGLPVPTDHGVEGWHEYGAVQLFVERARRVRRDFDMAEEAAGIVRICQLTEGMPLALELAATWTKSLDCATIADEIARSIDFLASPLRNVPYQHRSMQAVFDHSWAQLSPEERMAFSQLSVFRSGFRREAAEQVAGASLAVLSSLLDKSFLRWDPAGRYQIQELLRQYGEQKLQHELVATESTGAMTRQTVYQRHAHYFADFLDARAHAIVAHRQAEVIQEIEAELDNVWAAWQWAVNAGDVAALHKAAPAFYNFCDFRSHFQTGAAAMEAAIVRLDGMESTAYVQQTLALLLCLLGWHYIRLGQFEDARAAFTRSQILYRELNLDYPPGFGTDARLGLGLLSHVVGNNEEAITLAAASYQEGEVRGDGLNVQIALYVLENAHCALGNHATAQRYAHQAYVLTKEWGNHWMTAQFMRDLGNMARMNGHEEQARVYFQESYEIKEKLRDQEGMAISLTHLGSIALAQGNHEEAQQLYARSVQIYRAIDDPGGRANALCGLGWAAALQGERHDAHAYFAEALQIADQIRFLPLNLAILTGVGELFRQTGQTDHAVEILALVLHHPASEHGTKEKARTILAQIEGRLPTERFNQTFQQGAARELDDVLAAVQATLIAPPQEQKAMPDDWGDHDDSLERTLTPEMRAAGLIEPLTARELEVLHHLAIGLTNQEIAEQLILSTGTVKWYTGQIYGKLAVRSRTHAVARARELALLN